MKILRVMFLFTVSLLAVLPDYARSATLPPVSIRFKDQASVDGETVRLGDIARIIAGDERIVAQLETLEVAKSAGFGLTRMIDTDCMLNRYLKAFSDEYLFDLDHKIVRVTTRSIKLPTDSMTHLVNAFLDAQPKLKGQVVTWEIARAPENLVVPLCKHTLELAYLGVKRKGKVELNLAIRGETHILRNIPISVNVRVEEPVLVAKTQVERGAKVGSDNVSIEMRETTQINDLAISEPTKLMGNLAKVTIARGRIVTPNMLALPPAVKRGQGSKIVFHNGSVNVTTDVVCRQDGAVGQIIIAKNLANNRLVRVRVLEDGVLEPIPGG